MTDLSAAQIYGFLLNNVISHISQMRDAMAIVYAESGGRTDAVGPAGDYGLWQINRIHFGDGIINSKNWSDPYVSCREAKKLSANGTNWAAWCTAWGQPRLNCGHGYLPHIQAGSAAWYSLTKVDTFLRTHYGGNVPGAAVSKGGRSSVGEAWGGMQTYYGKTAPQQWSQLRSAARAIAGVRPHI